MVYCIADQDGMPKGLKITNCTRQVLYDSTWIAGVDYDEDEFEDENYDPDSEEEKDSVTILEWIPVMVDTVPLIIWLVYVVLMKNFHCCQRIQQRQSYKLRVHGVNPQSPLKV
jgi:hypothetical protein